MLAVTEMYIDDEDQNGVDLQQWFETWDDSTSTVEGHLVFQEKEHDNGEYLVAEVDSVTAATGYYKIGIDPISFSGNPPWADGTDIVFQFTRSGDVGAGTQGSQGTTGAGTQGTTGSQGITGDPGTPGAQGTQGIRGTSGNTGSQGATGTSGGTGSQGSTGTQGTTGAGTQGTTGAQGATGTQGAGGSAGSQGSQGTTGATGGGGGGTSISHAGTGGSAITAPAPATWFPSGAPFEVFDMASAGMVPDGYLYATVSGTVYYWPSWIAL